MDDLDKRLLTAVQADLPVTRRPFDALAERLGASADDVLARVGRLIDNGVIRRLGPVFDSRHLGYVSTLVAAQVPPAKLDTVARRVNLLPGVTHNYERQHAYNLWFTLTCPSEHDLERTLETLRQETGVPAFHSLPATAVYKIRVAFDLTDEADASGARETPAPAPPCVAAALSDEQKELVRLLQDGLPAEREPFAPAAKHLGWTPAQVVEQVRAWIEEGVIRRFGAVVRHRELGFRANGMAVFRVPSDRIDEAGRRLAARAEVSHCYRRPPLPGFPYNLYAMTHGRSENEVFATVAEMADEAGLADYAVLFSIREFKKVSMRYFAEDKPV